MAKSPRPLASPLACLLVLAGASCFSLGVSHFDWKVIGIALGIWVMAWLVQFLASRGLDSGEARRVEIAATREARTGYTSFFGIFFGVLSFAAGALLGLEEGQCLFLGLTGILAGAFIGYLATPALLVSEARNPSGFRRS